MGGSTKTLQHSIKNISTSVAILKQCSLTLSLRKSDLADFTPSKTRQFYSSKGGSFGVKGLNLAPEMYITKEQNATHDATAITTVLFYFRCMFVVPSLKNTAQKK